MRDITAAVKLEVSKRGLLPRDITELNLDAKCKAQSLQGLGALSSLQTLSLSNVGLATLEGFPRLPKLRVLILSDNRISGGLEHIVNAGLSSLEELDLSGNKITELSSLEPLVGFRLRSLDLGGSPVETVPDFRQNVFKMLQTLQYLNNEDIFGRERKLAEEDYVEEDADDYEEEDDDEDEADEPQGVEQESGEEDEEGADEGGDDEGEEVGQYAQGAGDDGEDDDDEEGDEEEEEEYEEEEDEEDEDELGTEYLLKQDDADDEDDADYEGENDEVTGGKRKREVDDEGEEEEDAEDAE